jgi:hypothetical protein
MLQARRSQVQVPIRSLDFSFDLIFPAALMWRVAANILNKQSGTDDKGWF